MFSKSRLPELVGGIVLGSILAFVGCWSINYFWIASYQPETSITNEVENRSLKELNVLEIARLDSALARRQAVLRAVVGMDEGQIVELISHTRPIVDSTWRQSTREVLFEALAYVDQEQALQEVWQETVTRRESLLRTVMSVWSIVDFDASMNAAARLNGKWQSVAFQAVLRQRQDVLNENSTELAKSWDISDIVDKLTLEMKLEELAKQPDQAFKLAIYSDQRDFHKTQLVAMVAQQWYEQEGSESVIKMMQLLQEAFDEDVNFAQNSSSLVSIVASLDPNEAWNFYLSIPSNQRERLLWNIGEAVLKQDAMTAITLVNSLDNNQFLPEERVKFFNIWSKLFPTSVLEQLEFVPAELRSRVVPLAVPGLVAASTPEAVKNQLEVLSKLGENTHEANDALLDEWSKTNPVAALTWYLDVQESLTESGGYGIELHDAFEELALEQSEIAMKLALSQPIELFLETRVLMSLLTEGRIDEAVDLLPQVREYEGFMESTTSVYAAVGYQLVEATRFNEAIKLGNERPEQEREKYFESLARRWMRNDIESLLKNLDRFPSNGIQSKVAEELRTNQGRGLVPSLTPTECQFVNSYISSDRE